MEQKRKQEEDAKTKAVAYQGYKPQTENGMVITPGSQVKTQKDNADKLGLEVLSNSTKMGEMISAMVVKIASNTIRQGIGRAKSEVQRTYMKQIGGVAQQRKQLLNTDPGKIFKSPY